MSNSCVNVEESNKKNELNILLNSPIIPKKIQEIIPSPLFLSKNRNFSKDKFILDDDNEKDSEDEKDELSISINDSDNENNSTDEDDSLEQIGDDNKTEGKIFCILDLLKEISREKYN